MVTEDPGTAPSAGVFLTAEWRHLAMLNYEVDPSLLLKFVPSGTELDSWNGKTFLSLVGFCFLKTKVLGLSLPFPPQFRGGQSALLCATCGGKSDQARSRVHP